MKKRNLCGIVLVLFLLLCVSISCSSGGPTSDDDGPGGVADQPNDPERPYHVSFSAAGIVFSFTRVPGKAFPTGVQDDGKATVSAAYWIAETEVTYELWDHVRTWALKQGYQIGYGHMGGDYLSLPGTVYTAQHPVTCVSWRDAVVWCNAATEWYNAVAGTDFGCVYRADGTPIKDSGKGTLCDASTPESGATGFRLPGYDEWELAARWRDDAVNAVAGYADPWFTTGESASGANVKIYDLTDANANEIFDGKEEDDRVAVYYCFWNQATPCFTGVKSTSPVKSKGVGGANALGLYDMSGNVAEWCFDTAPGGNGERFTRGGGFHEDAYSVGIGVSDYYLPPEEWNQDIGFRLARSE
jgi:formylglycine-generating enzyme